MEAERQAQAGDQDIEMGGMEQEQTTQDQGPITREQESALEAEERRRREQMRRDTALQELLDEQEEGTF